MNTLLQFMDYGHEILNLCRDAQLAGVKYIYIVPASRMDDGLIETESRGRSNQFKTGAVYLCEDHYISSDSIPLQKLFFIRQQTKHQIN